MSIKLGLSNENFKWLSDKIGCEPEMVIAVSKVECKRAPFDSDGFPAILYERHVFYRCLVKLHGKVFADKIAKNNSDICWKSGYGSGGYGSFALQRVRFSKAFAIDKDAAMMACSWGPFQELGENYEDYEFKTVGDFVDTMKDGLGGACEIFILSIKHRGLNSAMRTKSFAKIAKNYNGAGYKEFHYDEQIEDEYNLAKKLKIDWSKIQSKEAPRKRQPIWIGQFIEKDVTVDTETELHENINQPTKNKVVDELQGESVKEQPVESEVPKKTPSDTISIITGAAQSYIPTDIQDQVKEGLITQVKARAYTWIQFIIGSIMAAFVWIFKEGGWIYAVLLIALVIIGFQLYSWLVVWLKNKDRDRISENEKLRLELEKLKAEHEHEKLMFEAKSQSSTEMIGISFKPNPPDTKDIQIGDTASKDFMSAPNDKISGTRSFLSKIGVN